MSEKMWRTCVSCGRGFLAPWSAKTCSRSCRGALAARTARSTPPEVRELRRRAYSRWRGMVGRCVNDENISYKDYGARGISVCPEWLESFDAYYAYVGDAPGPDYTLDRIDNDGDYRPGNVRWATWSEQNLNSRRHEGRGQPVSACRAGHAYDAQNTYVSPDGRRMCRACRLAAGRRYAERRKARSAN